MSLEVIVMLYFLLVLLVSVDLLPINCQLLEELDTEFHDINEMFPSFTKPTEMSVISRPPNIVVRNISLDLEKIDVDKFRRKLDKYIAKFAKYDRDLVNVTDRLNGTRRMPYYGYDIGRDEWGRAQEHVVKTKCLDMALQVIYMARHKIRQLENMRYFNRHDTSYRIAFLYRRLRKIWKKMLDIITTMRKKKDDRWGPFTWIDPYLELHHKAAILHVDFVYMWWVLVNLHDKYKIHHFIPNTTPMS